MTQIAKLMRAELGVKAHWSFDGAQSLCGRGFQNALIEVRNVNCSSFVCLSCKSSMARLVEVAHVDALSTDDALFVRCLVNPEEAHSEALRMDERRATVETAPADVTTMGRDGLLDLGHKLNLPESALMMDTKDLRARIIVVKDAVDARLPAKLCDHGIAAGYPCSICREDASSAPRTAPLYVRITEGSEDQENVSFSVRTNETFSFGALGWSGGLRHVDLYRANGERVRFDLEYFKKVAVAVDHINFKPQPRGLDNPALRRKFVQAGKSAEVRLSELQSQISFLAGYFRTRYPEVHAALIEARDRSW